jgi:hypothetical protein
LGDFRAIVGWRLAGIMGHCRSGPGSQLNQGLGRIIVYPFDLNLIARATSGQQSVWQSAARPPLTVPRFLVRPEGELPGFWSCPGHWSNRYETFRAVQLAERRPRASSGPGPSEAARCCNRSSTLQFGPAHRRGKGTSWHQDTRLGCGR